MSARRVSGALGNGRHGGVGGKGDVFCASGGSIFVKKKGGGV